VKTPAQVLSFVADARGWPSAPLDDADVSSFVGLVNWDEGWKLRELADRVESTGLPGSSKLAYLYRQAADNADDGREGDTADMLGAFVQGVGATTKKYAKGAGRAVRATGRAYRTGLKRSVLLPLAVVAIGGAWLLSE